MIDSMDGLRAVTLLSVYSGFKNMDFFICVYSCKVTLLKAALLWHLPLAHQLHNWHGPISFCTLQTQKPCTGRVSP